VNQRADKAFELYNDLKLATVVPKLRTFHPLLSVLYAAYTSIDSSSDIRGDELKDIFYTVFDDLVQTYQLVPSEREYLIALEFAAKSSDNMERFYSILHNMMEDVMIPETNTSWNIIQRSFKSSPLNVTTSISPVDSNGVIHVNSEILQSIDLDADTRKQLLNQLESFAVLADPNRKVKVNNKIKEARKQNQIIINSESSKSIASVEISSTSSEAMGVESNRNNNNNDNSKRPVGDEQWRGHAWNSFKLWLEKAQQTSEDEHRPFDIVVDGANVGYYKQNYAGAPTHVDYQQIQQMLFYLTTVRHLKPLLVLHCRHVDENNMPSGIEGEKIKQLVSSWRHSGLLYATPRGLNDDWFWLFAAVKYGCKVVTNDEMRDHHFQLLSPRWFSRWKERHQVHFQLGSWVKVDAVGDSNHKKRKVEQPVSNVWHASDDECDEGSEKEGNDHWESSSASSIEEQLQREIEKSGSSSTYVQKTRLSSSQVDYQQEDGKSSNNIDTVTSVTAMRQVVLQWPLIYSHRMQFIRGRRYTGYYFPKNVSTRKDSHKGNEGINAEYDNEWLCIYAENNAHVFPGRI